MTKIELQQTYTTIPVLSVSKYDCYKFYQIISFALMRERERERDFSFMFLGENEP